MSPQKTTGIFDILAQYAVGAAVCLSALPSAAFADRAYLQDRAPAPYTVDGQLKANARDYGYYPTIWKRWPGTRDQLRDGQGPPPPSSLPKSDVPTKEEEDKAMPKPDRATGAAPRADASASSSEDKAPELPLDLSDPAPLLPVNPTRPRTRTPDPRRAQPAPDGFNPPRDAQPSGLPDSTIPQSPIPQSLDDVFPIDPGGSTFRQSPAIQRGLSTHPVHRAEYQSTAIPTRIKPRERQAPYRSQAEYRNPNHNETKAAVAATQIQFRIAQPEREFVRDHLAVRDAIADIAPAQAYARSSQRLAQPRPISPPADPAPSFSVQGESHNPLRPRGSSIRTTQRDLPSINTQIRPSQILPPKVLQVAHYEPIDAAPALPVAKSLGATRSSSNNPLRAR